MISLTDARKVRQRTLRSPDMTTQTFAAAMDLRLGFSQYLGVDTDLILGPVIGSEGQFARQAREDALADMAAEGFADLTHVAALVAVIHCVTASTVDDVQDDDDAQGDEHDDGSSWRFWGCAA